MRLAAPPAIVYSSSNKVYGDLAGYRIVERDGRYWFAELPGGDPEDFPLDFRSPYGCSKGAAGHYVLDYGRVFGLKTVIFRQSCVYGARHFGLEGQGCVAWCALGALEGELITIYGDGKQVRDVLYIGDLVAAFAAAERLDWIHGRA